ncbi:MAG: hypothetical protein IT372_15465 [Polyangiaceae bacterium]|nr:hypothetical protein [Polyangiaceae bacterium]
MLDRRSLSLMALAAALCPALIACNALTGAEDLIIKGEDGSGASGTGAGTGTGTGGAGTTSTGTTPQDPMSPATGVSIREIAIYQGVKRPLMTGGAHVDSIIPVVTGRDALIRVFYDLLPDYNGQPVTARLTIDGQAPIDVVQPLSGSSSDGSLQTTINFDVPASMMVGGMGYRVDLLQVTGQGGGDNPAAVFPAAGSDPINVAPSPATLQVKLIPIAYGADGSNRTPDTSQTQLDRYRDLFLAMYPITSIDLTVHAPVQWDSTISPNGAGWESLLNALADFRAQENAPANVYYYGIFAPASSIQEFCGGGCVAGLGFVTTPGDSYGRVAIGIGFTGDIATETAVHEVGHNHGRNHAPCGGPSGVDQSYPYSGGKIGTWGYNILSHQLFSPTNTTDVMGYCQPIWISDYNFRALFSRIQGVDGANVIIPPELFDLTWERVQIDAQGNAAFLAPVSLHRPPMADATPVELVAPSGATTTVQGQLYRYDHLGGGLLLFPRGSAQLASAKIHLAGSVVTAIK